MSFMYTYKGDSTRTRQAAKLQPWIWDKIFQCHFFCLQSKTITPAIIQTVASYNGDISAWCSTGDLKNKLFCWVRKIPRASPLGTVPRKTKRNETLQDKNNDNLLSDRLKKKKKTGLGTGKLSLLHLIQT